MELQNGRPADAAGRLEKEIRTYDFLDELGVDYQRVDHEAAFTMEACKEVDEALSVEMCKNLFLCNRQKTDFYLLLLLGDKVFKTKELSKQIGSARLSFARLRIHGKISGYYSWTRSSIMGDEVTGTMRCVFWWMRIC